MVTAGAPPSPAVIRAAEEIGADVAHAYGLTETYGPHTICAWHAEWDELPVAERAQIKARQGVAYVIAGTDLRVADWSQHRARTAEPVAERVAEAGLA